MNVDANKQLEVNTTDNTIENNEVVPTMEQPRKVIPRFIDREKSWLDFNKRVLEQAMRADMPYNKRLEFIGIAANNLDEFISVRFSGIYHQHKISDNHKDREIYKHLIREIKAQKNAINDVASKLLSVGVVEKQISKREDKISNDAIKYFEKEIYPVLTPIMLGKNKEVPRFNDDDLNLFIKLKSEEGDISYAFLQIPHQLERVAKIGGKYYHIENIIVDMLHRLFNSGTIVATLLFKVTKEYDSEIDSNDQISIIDRVNDVLVKREENNIIFLDINCLGKPIAEMTQPIRKLYKLLKVEKKHIYYLNHPSHLRVLNQQYLMTDVFKKIWPSGLGNATMVPLKPTIPSELDSASSILDYLDDDDLVLHHPYESFDVFIGFLKEACNDPDVITIKQTLYRVSSEKSPIIKALCNAAMSGKKVTVMLELLARFDEKQNIKLINTLNRAGCNIVYSIDGLKTHAKMCIVTKQTKKGIVTYSHVGTGNYNEKTAKVYTDISYFTSNKVLGKELTEVFNMITGFSKPEHLNRILYSPNTLRTGLMDKITEYAKLSTGTNPSTITMKINSLSDFEMVSFLHHILSAYPTMKMNIICRGICSMPAIHPNLTIKSIVGRFLEHSRIYSFENSGKSITYISSADLLTRNLDKRIEIMTPIYDKSCNKRIRSILDTFLKDDVNSYIMEGDQYKHINDDTSQNNCHVDFIRRS